ncbi:MAG TPA: patatin-like phospholipase family protein [Tepidisphaeraceae bacterium]|nr:patatin-like phospholipase family protein [Tepidisphaeraceae bacterium]
MTLAKLALAVSMFTVICALAGCGGKSLNTIVAKMNEEDVKPFIVQNQEQLTRPAQQFADRQKRRAATRPTTGPRIEEGPPYERFKILVLSGGGQFGAWGSGYLKGWDQRDGNAKRPQFDVVTGISTGGLMTTGALLPDDEALKHSYTEVTQRDVMRLRFLPPFTLFWADSIYSTAPLGEQIQKIFTTNVIDVVAREADTSNGKRGRRAYVATCQLESGTLVIWDLSEIAIKKQYDLYRAVVLATASLPAAFPPVNIAGKHYVDGGARSNLFLDKAVLPTISSASDQARGQLDVFVLINGKTNMDEWTMKNSTLDIAFRSVSMLLNSSEMKDIDDIRRLVLDRGGTLHLAYIPENVPTGSEHQFDRSLMNDLYTDGIERGANGQWQEIKPEPRVAAAAAPAGIPAAPSPPVIPMPVSDQEWKKY